MEIRSITKFIHPNSSLTTSKYENKGSNGRIEILFPSCVNYSSLFKALSCYKSSIAFFRLDYFGLSKKSNLLISLNPIAFSCKTTWVRLILNISLFVIIRVIWVNIQVA